MKQIPKYRFEEGVTRGLAIGVGPSNWRGFDIDNCRDMSVVRDITAKLGLPEDYPWLVESPHGYHIWFRSEELTGSLKEVPEEALDHVYVGKTVDPRPWSQIELRWAKAYLIIPPTNLSNHGGTNRYRWLNGQPTVPPALVGAKAVKEVFVGLVDDWDFHLPNSPYDPYDEWEEPEDDLYDYWYIEYDPEEDEYDF